jgi:hypothetical protein
LTPEKSHCEATVGRPGPQAHHNLRDALLLAACLIASAVWAGDTQSENDRRTSPASPGTPAVAEHLKAALDEGYIIGESHLHSAQKHLALARREGPGDPRIDYVQGLIHLRQLQIEPACAHFEAARKLDRGRYWPAWQADIWGHFVNKQYENGFAILGEYAKLVARAEKPDEISEAQRHAARWIGELLEALALCGDSKKVHGQLTTQEAQLQATFAGELLPELAAGRESIHEREAVLDQESSLAHETAERKREQRHRERASKLEKEISRLGKTENDDKKSAAEWKEWLESTLAKADRQIGLLERDYQYLEQRAQSVMQSITLAGQEMTAVQIGTFNRRSSTNPGPALNADFQWRQGQGQLLGYQLEYNATIGRMNLVVQQANMLVNQRAEAIERYQNATGALVQKDANLDKWATRLNQNRQKLTVQKPQAQGKKNAPDGPKQPYSLKVYLPLDLLVEKSHVLATFSPPAEPKRD